MYGANCRLSQYTLLLLPTKRIFCDCYSNVKHFRCGVERVKRGVNVHLHCIASNLKMISKISTLPPLEIFLRKPIPETLVTLNQARSQVLRFSGAKCIFMGARLLFLLCV